MMPHNTPPLFTEIEFEVKTYDIDFAAHVNNQVYIRWLEDLRLALLNRYYPLEPQMRAGIAPLLTRTDIRYRRAIRLFEPVVGRMWVEKLSGVRIYLRAQITVGELVCADVSQEAAFTRLDAGVPTRIPEELRAVFEQWTVAE